MSVTRLQLLPGVLDAALHTYAIPALGRALPCWTLVTSGLAAHGQRELVVTLLRSGDPDENLPGGVPDYLRSVFDQAKEGRTVGNLGYTAWRPPVFGGFAGAAYFDAPAVPGISLPGDALAAVFLKEGEVEMALNCSVQRVLNGLGNQARYFPVPYWTEPARDAVYGVGDAARSILTKLKRVSAPDSTAILRGDVCTLAVSGRTAEAVAEHLEARRMIALLPGRDPAVGAALVWVPGQERPAAMFIDGKDPSAMAAAFVALVPGSGPEDSVTFLEDGYGAVLAPETAKRLAGALRNRASFDLQGGSPRRVLSVAVSPG